MLLEQGNKNIRTTKFVVGCLHRRCTANSEQLWKHREEIYSQAKQLIMIIGWSDSVGSKAFAVAVTTAV
jgi:hypothetical protein